MAVCVGCGLEISEAGKLVVKLDPAGGITCSDNGLSAAAALASSDDAAMTCCNEAKAQAAAAHTAANEADDTADAAQSTANTANSKADTALDRVPNRIRWGIGGGITNAFGDVVFAHGLGGDPTSVALTPINNVADLSWVLAVENTDATNVNVRVYQIDGSGFHVGISVAFYWFAAL